MASSTGPSASGYNQSSHENSGGAFSNSMGANGGAPGRSTMPMLPVETLQSQPANHGVSMAQSIPSAVEGSHVSSTFHDHNALSAAAPEILTQMGYRRPQPYGPDEGWSNGSSRPHCSTLSRMDNGSPVLVLQPGWGVTLPPYFLGMMDSKRPRNVPVKVCRVRLQQCCIGEREVWSELS